jgi:GDP-L-fucose synthase
VSFWESKRVLVTGGGGFLGSHVVRVVEDRGCRAIFAPRSRERDLRKLSDIQVLLDETKPDIIIHLAAVVGGIGANMARPGTFLYDNLTMGLHLIEEARQRSIAKFVCIGTVCAYPKHTTVPFKESELWSGYPEETNAPYGLAKKMLLVQLQAYREEFGFEGIYLLPVNLYGPGDNFDPQSSHVIPAMIRKFEDARLVGSDSVTLWGDGSPTREFLYVKDAAEGIVTAAELYEGPEPVNLGTGREISISDLGDLIRKSVGFEGVIAWNPDMPNGQPRRCLDTTRAKSFGFSAKTDFADGLDRTIAWYRQSSVYQHKGQSDG